MKLLVITLNLLGWPIIQISLARLFLLLPDRYFSRDSWLTRSYEFEQNGTIYRKLLSIHRWKRLLPDGAAWLGGRRKREFANRCVSDLSIFAAETRRGETAHWCMLLCIPLFYVWNPSWACVVMTLYGISANLPCILVQRANRIKVVRILKLSGDESTFIR